MPKAKNRREYIRHSNPETLSGVAAQPNLGRTCSCCKLDGLLNGEGRKVHIILLHKLETEAVLQKNP